MYLKDITDKPILTKTSLKGYCRGVGISPKTHAVKYLLCASAPYADPDFTISSSLVESVGAHLQLSALRPLRPQNCIRIFLGRPVYSFEGVYLGKITDLVMRDFVATHLYTDQNATYPITSITAGQDAVLIKKEPPFPLGQRIPAPLLPLFTEKKDSVVTKPILRNAAKQGRLICLTLSLPPFQTEGDLIFGREF